MCTSSVRIAGSGAPSSTYCEWAEKINMNHFWNYQLEGWHSLGNLASGCWCGKCSGGRCLSDLVAQRWGMLIDPHNDFRQHIGPICPQGLIISNNNTREIYPILPLKIKQSPCPCICMSLWVVLSGLLRMEHRMLDMLGKHATEQHLQPLCGLPERCLRLEMDKNDQ